MKAECKTVSELAACPLQTGSFPLIQGCWLHYNGPGSSGFGVKRTAMLMPETAMLMVGPLGCSRSGTVVAEENAFAHRMFYLYLDDRSVALGTYLRRIPEAVRTIAETGEFKAVLICMTCLDALTGTDLEGLGRRIEADIGIAVTTTFMDPIVRDGHNSPMVQVRRAIIRRMERTVPKDDSVNVLGLFAPLKNDCELSRILKNAGVNEIHTVSGCKAFEELQAMGNSRINIVVHPQSVSGAEEVSDRLSLPYTKLFTTYDPEKTARNYDRLGENLGAKLQYAEYKQKAEDRLADLAKRYAGAAIGIGEAITGNPFDMACILIKAGFNVPFVFRDRIQPSDREALEELATLTPELPVYSGVHPTTFRADEPLPKADIIIGTDAAYFAPETSGVAWPFEESKFGFESLELLCGLIQQGFSQPQTIKSQLHGSYLTI